MGECFLWYRPTRVVPDKGCVCVCVFDSGGDRANTCVVSRNARLGWRGRRTTDQVGDGARRRQSPTAAMFTTTVTGGRRMSVARGRAGSRYD